jgi:hypothetical protein
MTTFVEVAALLSAAASMTLLHAGRGDTVRETLRRPHAWGAAALLGFACWHFVRPARLLDWVLTGVAVLACVWVATALAVSEARNRA